MIELFEQDVKTNDRQSSKGNQLKWKKNDIWYKVDYTGYEGLVEYVVSKLLSYSNLKENEYVSYNLEEIKYKSQVYNGVSSKDFLHEGFQIITLERLFQSKYNDSLHKSLWLIKDEKERLKFLVEKIEEITGLSDFGKYMNKLLTVDALFLNEDRHTHNIAILINGEGKYYYCPIYDNGAGLLSDTIMDYPLGEDIYKLIDSVKGKTFSLNLEEQMLISEELYGTNLTFRFTKKDVENILFLDDNNEQISIYPIEIRKRVRDVIFEQMRKYPYLFE